MPKPLKTVRRERAARLTTRERIAREVTEAELQANVIKLAEALGYVVIHVRDSRRKMVEGLPDLTIGRKDPPRLLYAELKREAAGGRHTDLTPWQELWRAIILGAGNEWYLWRPSDWLSGEIERVLRKVREP